MPSEITQPRYQLQLFPRELEERRRKVKASGRLTERQVRKTIERAMGAKITLEHLKVVCYGCRREIKQTWWGRLRHAIVCWWR